MKLSAKVKLITTSGMFSALEDTLRESNRCCNWLSEQAWNTKVFAQFKIHKLAYSEARKQFPRLSSQIIVRCISKVSDSYKLDKKTKRFYRLDGAIAYDSRILNWYIKNDIVSIWTTSGRFKIPYLAGEKQKNLLRSQQGESDLVLSRGVFYLSASCNVDNPTPDQVEDCLGCDMGVTNILTDSDGRRYSGSHVTSVRHRHKRLRARLQKKGTKAAKRRLKNLSGKESRFTRNINHVISKDLVAVAKGTGRAISIENLSGIRGRFTVGRKMRGVLHSWAFAQLRSFIEYKAEREGVPVFQIDPSNTSRECSRCGHTSQKNRPDQKTFRCRQCGLKAHADQNAAWNIRSRGRAFVNRPYIANQSISSGADLVTS